MNFIVTAFNDDYWNPHGISWIASLCEFSKTSATPVVLNLGLNEKIVEHIQQYGVVVYAPDNIPLCRNDVFLTVAELSSNLNGKYLYFDADVWFQESIEKIFDLIDNKICISKNKNEGFVAGNQDAWKFFTEIHSQTKFFNDGKTIDCIYNYYGKNLKEISDQYNCINIANLEDKNKKLWDQNQLARVIHPTGDFKILSKGKKLLFHERYPELFSKYYYYPSKHKIKKFFKTTACKPIAILEHQ